MSHLGKNYYKLNITRYFEHPAKKALLSKYWFVGPLSEDRSEPLPRYKNEMYSS